MQLFNSDDTDIIITNLTKDLIYVIPFIESCSMSFNIRNKPKTRFLKPPIKRISGIDINMSVNAVFSDTTFIDWLEDELSFKVIYKGDISNKSFSIDNVSFDSPSISSQSEDFIRTSFSLTGITTALNTGILISGNGTLFNISISNGAVVTNSFSGYYVPNPIYVPSTTKKWLLSVDDLGVLSTSEYYGSETLTPLTIVNSDNSKWNLNCDDTGHIITTFISAR